MKGIRVISFVIRQVIKENMTSEDFLHVRMKALSWKEPFGTLMLHGKIETRSWFSHYQGWVLICCSKKGYSYTQVLEISGNHQLGRIVKLIGFSGLERGTEGMAIAVGRLVGSRIMKPEDEDECFVQYNGKRWCHIYKDVMQIEPLPWKGSQGWKNVDLEIKKQIKLI